MTKNLYKTTYEDQEIEYVECTEKEHQEETIRLKNLGVKFTTKIESTNGYAINWKGKSFASIIVESVIDQVVKFEKDRVQVKQTEKSEPIYYNYQNIIN